MVRTETYNRVSEFLKKYPLTIAFRLSKHVKILDKHLNEGEEVFYVFHKKIQMFLIYFQHV